MILSSSSSQCSVVYVNVEENGETVSDFVICNEIE